MTTGTLALLVACLSLLVSVASFLVPWIVRRIHARRAARYVALIEKASSIRERRTADIITDPKNYGGTDYGGKPR
jgi:hypothetical protein